MSLLIMLLSCLLDYSLVMVLGAVVLTAGLASRRNVLAKTGAYVLLFGIAELATSIIVGVSYSHGF